MKEMDDAIYIKLKKSDHDKIKKRMSEMGILNESAYLRKMAIDGMIINLDIPEITSLSSLLKRISNNINQIAKKVNSTGNIYQNEIDEIKNSLDDIQERLNNIYIILSKLA